MSTDVLHAPGPVCRDLALESFRRLLDYGQPHRAFLEAMDLAYHASFLRYAESDGPTDERAALALTAGALELGRLAAQLCPAARVLAGD